MPAELVTGEDADDVAAYVAYAADRRGDDEGALAEAGLAGATSGEQIFTAAGCGGCHSFSRAGTNGNIGPSLDDLAAAAGSASPEEFVRQSILDPDAEVTQGFQAGVMPSFEGRLNDKQLQALADYLLGN
jgi:cytochrome c oxidase subunit 2